ncbi:hypothetical protein CRUP_035476 [Coryphaenoides rupestris]|nr:hypothetical protein CRUP_035476 [Coryphaenoides rupestris]
MGSRIKENPESTFEVYLEVTFQGTQGTGPEVVRQFPVDYNEKETLKTVPRFCFPFSIDSLTVNHVGQNFTFVLTDIESKQRFGFCRLSSGAHSCYCILSYLPWFEVFYKLLNILADYTVKSQHSYFTVPDKRELPSIPENRNLTEYFVAVDVNNMLHLYASMLYERRILVCSSKLSTLTACIHGSAAMLYPMYWQHVYIPVLPQHLLDYCCAPMPYLIGVHTSLMEKVRGMALDDVVVLNVSSLKNRLKKVSTTTGSGVARAFLKSQAALFGSYRNALQIVAGEPITFSEETFASHRSSAMRPFLLNAIQLQLFKQFIDGRLDLLNAGEGFSDDFEEEINMGEYAGSDKTYHQWLFTVKKGGGAIFNTVKTKANPAMKTVYKFAKDHAKMGFKEVKSRLKQKEHAENGYSTAGSPVIDEDATITTSTATVGGGGFMMASTGAPQKESLPSWEDDNRPITMLLGPARPPMLAKRPIGHIGLDSSLDQPQPYRSLKEAESMEGEEPGAGAERHTAPSSPITERFSNVNLLGDIFNCQDEPENPSVNLAKSLEDLRTPKSLEELQAKFTYQRMDLSISDRTRTLPGLKLTNPYNKLWAGGPDDGAAPPVAWDRSSSSAAICNRPPPQRPPPPPPPPPTQPCPSPGPDPATSHPSTPSQGNITIPRPPPREDHPRALPPRCRRQEATANGAARSGGQEFRHALGMSADGDLLKPTPAAGESAIDLLSLLDPLSSSSAADARR